MSSPDLPRAFHVDPFRLEADLWIDVPHSIDERSRPGHPQETASFWQGLRDDEIRFHRCGSCQRYSHYPVGGCQWCGGHVDFVKVDGLATVNTWTLSLLAFGPGMETPYITAIVNPHCEPGIQLMTNLVRCNVSDIRIGMEVQPLIFHGSDTSLLFYEPS